MYEEIILKIESLKSALDNSLDYDAIEVLNATIESLELLQSN